LNQRIIKGVDELKNSLDNMSERGVTFAAEPTVKEFRTEVMHTPRVGRDMIYVDPSQRRPDAVAPPSTLTRPNYEDILRRVAVVIHQHIKKCEDRYKSANPDELESGLFHESKMHEFSEEHFVEPEYVYHFVRAPLVRIGFCYGIRQATRAYSKPDLKEVHDFLGTLFVKAQLSAECSIVCLIYVERLMEQANVPITGTTWRPLCLCGLLLASKVWQDLGSWNVEFSEIYPKFSLRHINQLERLFCQRLNWDLYISSSLYAKYYFALRSLTARTDFRRKYNVMMTEAPGAEMVSQRSEGIKEEFLATTLSQSL
jgi:hypothetical protein